MSSPSSLATLRLLVYSSLLLLLFCLTLPVPVLSFSSQQQQQQQHHVVTYRRARRRVNHHREEEQACFSRGSSLPSCSSTALAAGSSASSSLAAATSLSSSSSLSLLEQQRVVIDGPEWASYQSLLLSSSSAAATESNSNSKQAPAAPAAKSSSSEELFGCLTVVVLQDDTTKQRFVAVQAPEKVDHDNDAEGFLLGSSSTPVSVYRDTVAELPKAVSNAQAISTLRYALTHVHAVLHVLTTTTATIGGSNQVEPLLTARSVVVVLGGNPRALQAAASLSCFIDNVYVITTNSKVKPAIEGVTVLPPAIGELEIGFAAYLGNLDVVLDTMGQEDEDEDVVRLLQKRHGCQHYLSTLPKAQSMVQQEGLVWGPGQVDRYRKALSTSTTSDKDCLLRPLPGLGATVQTLLQKGITFSMDGFTNQKVHIPSWSWDEFWEASTWPRDSSASTNVRFGLPVVEDLEEEDALEEDNDEIMIAAPPMRGTYTSQEEEKDGEEDSMQSEITSDNNNNNKNNPFVLEVVSVRDLQDNIIVKQQDCVLFLSAPFCRTCRYVLPQYQRMARMSQEDSNNNNNIVFAKADTSGTVGKELGRALQVDSVPTFVLFRKGKRYGEALSIARLPSKKLQLAVDWLQQGLPWDSKAIRNIDDKAKQ